MTTKRKIIVTSALPYANAELHLGHILEAVQTDIWVRLQKSLGNECHYFCADDTHGTPVMLKAEELGTTPEKLINSIQIDLKYYNGSPVIKKIKRVSKPGIRKYSKITELIKPYGGLGISILSTPKGVMSDQQAKKNNVGGEILCEVF